MRNRAKANARRIVAEVMEQRRKEVMENHARHAGGNDGMGKEGGVLDWLLRVPVGEDGEGRMEWKDVLATIEA